MQNKILSFIVKNNGQLLLLLNNPSNLKYGGSFYYTVTGAVEDSDKSFEDTVRREIKEETNLDIAETKYLNFIFKYKLDNILCVEYVYISFTNDDKVVLDKEENIDYIWCDLDEFINKIKWLGDLELLRKILSDGIMKKVFLKKEHVEECKTNFEIKE